MPRDDLQHVPQPAALDGASLAELVEGYKGHRSALVQAELGLGQERPVRLRGSALDALAIGEQLTRRMAAERWVTVADALTYGASVAEVGQALDMEPGDVARVLSDWADGQRRYGGMTAERHAELLRLVGAR
jgi:hypothetical protein